MSKSEHKIINGNKILIVCFGGMVSRFGGIIPFEFLNYLSSVYLNICDLCFFIDEYQCWYHKGINDIIKNGNYEKVLFMGVSAGGYAAILFGSLCNNINNVISFIPQTIIHNNDSNYSNLKNIINKSTNYLLYGDKCIKDNKNLHHISHCENLKHFSNVKIIKGKHCDLKILRNNGYLKTLIDSIIL